MANPELKDPIYNDYLAEKKAIEGAVLAEETSLVEIEKLLTTIDARDPQRRRSLRERDTREKNLTQLKQRVLYLAIRSEQRKAFVKKDYLKAFHAKQAWPDPGEFEAYKQTKALKSAPREWDKRVPKLTRHLKPSQMPVAEVKKEEKSDGH